MTVKKIDFKQMFQAIKIREVMVSPVITLNETDDFVMVHEKLSLHGFRHLPVINDFGCLVGIITQRDLFQIHSPHRLDNGTWYYDKESLSKFLLKRVMVSDPYSLNPGNSLYEAIDAMVRFKYGCIPIVDENNKPCGILTRHSVLKFLIAANS